MATAPPTPERFALLASAIAGRRVLVVPGDAERAYCDGERIYTSEGAAHGDRDTLVVQAALLASGSLEPRVVVKLAARRRLRHRYLTLEAARATAQLAHVVPQAIAQRVAALYAGPLPASAQESLALAASERVAVPEAPDWMGTIRPARLLMGAPGFGSAPTEQDLNGTSRRLEMPELDEDEDTERSRILELFQAPAMQNPLAQYLMKLLGMGRSAAPEDGAGGDELPVGGERAGRVGANAKPLAAPEDVAVQLVAVPVGRRYPEWSWVAGRYREDWCAVAEHDPRPRDDAALEDPGEDRRLRRELARLGLAHERHRRQDEGDVLDISALVELVVDRGAGVIADPRVYELKRRTAHDLGVVVLLDATGSTGESAEGQRVFDEQRRLAARLTAVFDELGDRVASYGFQSWGRDRVQFLRVKGFDDRYDHAAQLRLASLEPGGFTRLGAAIRHATHLLSTQAGTGSTLLIVVGDGLPYDDGYEHRYAQEDSRRALAEAVRAGVACACVSVRSATDPEVLERVWGHVAHHALERPSDLARHATPMFRRALREAAASRRAIGTDVRQAVLT